jgi:hypothetical protein
MDVNVKEMMGLQILCLRFYYLDVLSWRLFLRLFLSFSNEFSGDGID